MFRAQSDLKDTANANGAGTTGLSPIG